MNTAPGGAGGGNASSVRASAGAGGESPRFDRGRPELREGRAGDYVLLVDGRDAVAGVRLRNGRTIVPAGGDLAHSLPAGDLEALVEPPRFDAFVASLPRG